jgi:hypothetical protein
MQETWDWAHGSTMKTAEEWPPEHPLVASFKKAARLS